MKGYFSQLAKQSGIRLAGQSERPGSVKTSSALPLHEEKTVFVRPDLPEENKPKSQNSPRQFSEAEKRSQKTRSKEKNKPGKDSPEFPGLEQTVFKETDQPTELNFSQSPKSGLNSEISENQKPEPQPKPKEYFKKTGELRESDEVNREELQQILLQEVQAWVADGPELTEIEDVITPSVQISLSDEEERGTEQSGFVHRPDEKQGLEEQNFNLSIGTISIVIEDEEKSTPPESLPPKITAENKAAETRRPFSRLGRNYL